jgi:hypothetical protein
MDATGFVQLATKLLLHLLESVPCSSLRVGIGDCNGQVVATRLETTRSRWHVCKGTSNSSDVITHAAARIRTVLASHRYAVASWYLAR